MEHVYMQLHLLIKLEVVGNWNIITEHQMLFLEEFSQANFFLFF